MKDRRAILLWLLACATLVAAMVLIGGYTRLSGSGLSITQWKPLHGAIPPLSASDWQAEFDAYRQSPQYLKVNNGMGIEDFKTIFWPEFLHRLLGRAIGVVFFLPLIFFAARRSISRPFFWRLTGIFALGGLQGLVGWLMVKSGLVDDPHVSHLRLAAHLSVAFAIYGALVWTMMDVLSSPSPACGGGLGRGSFQNKEKSGTDAPPPSLTLPRKREREFFILWFLALCAQIILGAFMAGLHAGLIYNTWPDMNGQMLPDGLTSALPWYDNLTMVQFLHRSVAVFVAIYFLFWWRAARSYVKNSHLGTLCACTAVVIAVQFVLGVLTLVGAVPLPLAMLHQMTALLLFTLAVMLLKRTV